jgi:predicted CoA-binding protein
MQEGVIHKEAGEKAEKAGLKVVMDHCMKKEHQRLL